MMLDDLLPQLRTILAELYTDEQSSRELLLMRGFPNYISHFIRVRLTIGKTF